MQQAIWKISAVLQYTMYGETQTIIRAHSFSMISLANLKSSVNDVIYPSL